MAFHSDVAPPIGGEANKDTFDGDTKSDSETEEEEDIDLEEGEILDSGAESNAESNRPVGSEEQQQPNNETEETVAQKIKEIFTIAKSAGDEEASKEQSGKKHRKFSDYNPNRHPKKKQYVDHDHIDDEESNEPGEKNNWYQRSSRKKSPGPVDYRKELASYSPYSSSPERGSKKSDKKHRTKKSKVGKRKKRTLEMKRHYQKYAPCKYFLEGHCSKGSDCPFSHSSVHLRNKKKDGPKRELCRYYLNGFCSKGRSCTFMHDDFPCKFFHTGVECYSGENCRFSHEPLTDETRKLLQECLRGPHNHNRNNDEEPRKRRRSRTPEPPMPAKRPCLLGSPPRHIREGEETKKWQEEMMQLQLENNIEAFQITLKPMPQSPSKYVMPNFYVDTMQSPQKPSMHHNNNIPLEMNDQRQLENSAAFDEDLRIAPPNRPPNENLDWNKIHELVEMMSAPNQDPEPMVHPHEQHLMSNLPAQDPYAPANFKHEHQFPQSNSFQKTNQEQYCQDNANFNIKPELPLLASQPIDSSPSMPISDVVPKMEEEMYEDPPIVAPSHLPKMQQKLFMRIQKHQKLKSADSDDTQDLPDKAEGESQSNCEESSSEKEEEANLQENEDWHSTDDDDDDDDDDTDRPLTDVLKRLQQAPPPKLKEVPSPKPNIDLSEMLSSIMEKAKKNSQPRSDKEEKQDGFWKSVLLGTISSRAEATKPEVAAEKKPVLSDLNPLLPNPAIPKVEKPKVDIRDPRLKNRDPRKMPTPVMPPPPISNSVPTNIPPVTAMDQPLVAPPSPILPNHHRDINSVVPNNQAPAAVIVDGLKDNVPYKLHSVSIRPLNYTFYLQATHSDPKLQNDPRLRRHILPTKPSDGQGFDICNNPLMDPNSITLPELPLFTQIKLEKSDLASLVSQDNVLPVSLGDGLPNPPKNADPRTNKPIEIRRLSGNNTPPHPPISDPAWALPPVAPTPASHLPRAIADPRMAKLHHPVDPRRSRTRIIPEPISRQNSLLKVPTPAAMTNNTTTNSNTKIDPKPEEKKTEIKVEAEPVKKEVPVKKESNSKNKKAVHRNRKSSMDYASPLNAYNESNNNSATGNSKYNSYNKRPKKQKVSNPPEERTETVLPTVPSSGLPIIPDFGAGMLNLACDSTTDDVSLKDMFKTIDPTASPFC